MHIFDPSVGKTLIDGEVCRTFHSSLQAVADQVWKTLTCVVAI